MTELWPSQCWVADFKINIFLYVNLSLNISLNRNVWNQKIRNQNISTDLFFLYQNNVLEIKGKNLRIGILYFPDFLYKTTIAGKAGEILPCERMFVCQLKLSWDNGTILQLYGKISWKGLGHLQVCYESCGKKMSSWKPWPCILKSECVMLIFVCQGGWNLIF